MREEHGFSRLVRTEALFDMSYLGQDLPVWRKEEELQNAEHEQMSRVDPITGKVSGSSGRDLHHSSGRLVGSHPQVTLVDWHR